MRRVLTTTTAATALLVVACDGDTLGALEPHLQVRVASIEAPSTFVGYARAFDVELSNDGDATTHLRALTFTGDFAAADDAIDAVPPGDGTRLTLIFRPTRPGPQAGTLTLDSDATDRPRLVVELRGLGLETPSCADSNPCTDETFDPVEGRCVTTPNSAACDDGNPCTTEDVCDRGVCSGRLLACDDDNPCTVDTCDANGGCSNEDLPDGTACGPATQCVRANICVFGSCGEYDVPEGFECEDADPCTIDETCQAQRCTPGSRVVSEPELTGFAPTLGPYVSAITELPDGRVLALQLSARGTLLRTLSRSGDRLTVTDTATMTWPRGSGPGSPSWRGVSELLPLDNGRLVVVESGDYRTNRVHVLDLATRRFIAELTPPTGSDETGTRATTLGSRVVTCGPGSLRAYDTRGATVVPTWALSLGDPAVACDSIAADAARARVYAIAGPALHVIDVSSATVARTLRVLALDGDVRPSPHWAVVRTSERALVVLDASPAPARLHVYDPDTLARASVSELHLSIIPHHSAHWFVADMVGDALVHSGVSGEARTLVVTDLSRPEAPRVLGEERLESDDGLWASGKGLIVGAGRAYLVVPTNRDPIRRLRSPALAWPRDILAPRTVVGVGTVQQLDLTDPRRPMLTSPQVVPGEAQLYRSGTGRYAVVSGASTARLVDLTVPTAPRVLGEVTSSPGGRTCLARGGRALIGRSPLDDRLGIYDLTNLQPGPMTPRARLPLGAELLDLGPSPDTCVWNEKTGDLIVRDVDDGLQHIDTLSSGSELSFSPFLVPQGFSWPTSLHPYDRGLVTTTNDFGRCVVRTVTRNPRGMLVVAAEQTHQVACAASYTALAGAVYLRERVPDTWMTSSVSPELIAVLPGAGPSYARRFSMPYHIERMSLVDNRLVFVSDEGVGVMTAACPPP